MFLISQITLTLGNQINEKTEADKQTGTMNHDERLSRANTYIVVLALSESS